MASRAFSMALQGGLVISGRQWGRDLLSARPGRRIVAVHGWMDNCASFEGLAPLLVSAVPDLAVVAVDLPGHGRSSHLPMGVYAMTDYVRALWMFLQQIQWTRTALLGHSMGAGVCSLFAGTFPEHVERLMLVDGGAPVSQTADRLPEQLHQSVTEFAETLRRPQKSYPSAEAMVERILQRDLDRHSAETLLTGCLARDGDAFCFSHDPFLRVTSPLRLVAEQVDAFLNRVRCPTLLVVAEAGWPFGGDLVKHWNDCLRRDNPFAVVQRVVPGRHHVHLDTPAVVAPHVLDFFLKEFSPSPAI